MNVSISPIMPPKNTSAVARPAENARLRNRLMVTSGDFFSRSRRRSSATKAASTTALAPIETKVQAGQPASRPWMSGKTSRPAATVTSAAPPTWSRGGRAARDSGSSCSPATSAAIPIGTLTRKIMRQPVPSTSPSVSRPPITGPSTALPPITGPNRPNAFCSSPGGKASRMSPKALWDHHGGAGALREPEGDQHLG